MSIIAIKDLNEDTTLDQAAMSELVGGQGRHCPTQAPDDFLPSSNDRRREPMSFELGQVGTEVASQFGFVLALDPMCGAMDDVKY